MKTLLEVVNLSVEFLEKHDVKNSKREVLDLISFGLGLRPLDLYVQFDRPLVEAELEVCRGLLKRKIKGEPTQYIRGKVEFLDCILNVCPKVLIPRQETEILVDRIIKTIEREGAVGKSLLDLCSGSGCIGIALKKRFPELKVVMSDVSQEALEVARINAFDNAVDIEFFEGDFLKPLEGRQFNYLVCNPPYVSEEEFEDLEIEVRQFEPKIALVAEDRGLAFYKALALDFQKFLFSTGKVWLEIGYEQGKAILEIFKDSKAKYMEVQQDWSGLDRFFFLEIE